MTRTTILHLLAAALVVSAVVLFAHWPVLSAQALSLDDTEYLTYNHLVRNPGLHSTWRFVSEVLHPSTIGGYYHPLAMISLMLDYARGGRVENLRPFHETSLAIHVFNVLLIMTLIYMLFGRLWSAALTALLFGVHPLTVESIAWTGERKTPLAALFVLLSLIAYVRYSRSRGASTSSTRFFRSGTAAYAASFIAFSLSLLSKPTGTPLPVLLLLLDLWPLRRWDVQARRPHHKGEVQAGSPHHNETLRQLFVEKIPFFALATASTVITLTSHAETASIDLPTKGGLLTPLWQACYLLAFYAGKIACPMNLTSVYVLPQPMSPSNPWVLAGVGFVIALVAAAVVLWRRSRALVVVTLFFVLAILPMLGVVGYSWIKASDKYVYLPFVGVLIGLGAALAYLWGEGTTWTPRRIGATGAAGILALAAMIGTRHQLTHWQTTRGLFEHMVRLAPNNAIVRDGLAAELKTSGDISGAEREYRKAIELNRRYYMADANLGVLLMEQGQYAAAEEQFRISLRKQKVHPQANFVHNSLGNVLRAQGKLDEAIREYETALRLRPEFANTHINLGAALADKGDFPTAVEHFQTALRLSPDSAPAKRNLDLAQRRLAAMGAPSTSAAPENPTVDPTRQAATEHYNEGVSCFQKHDVGAARAAFEQAIAADPTFALAHHALGLLLKQSREFVESEKHLREAARLQPDNAAMLTDLGLFLAEQNRTEEALKTFDAAISADPTHPPAHRNRGVALSRLGRMTEAESAFREVVRLRPMDPDACCDLADLLVHLNRAVEAAPLYAEALKHAPKHARALVGQAKLQGHQAVPPVPQRGTSTP